MAYQVVDIKSLKPGDTIEFTGFMTVSPYGGLNVNATELKDYITIAPVQLSVVVPDGFNGIQGMIGVLEHQAEVIRDDAAKKLHALEIAKTNLLQLTYEGQEILDAEKTQ